MRLQLPGLSGPFFLLAILFVCSACVPLAEVEAPTSAQLQALLTPPPQVTPAMLAEPELEFLGLSPEMKDLVHAVAPPNGSIEQKLSGLIGALRHDGAYRIHYDAGATLTAAQAFRERRANCLAFSAMFIAMAREAGLDARFQEVDLPPLWDSEREGTLVQYRHVNVRVRLSRRGNGVVDLRMDRYRGSYPQQLISDQEALAHYHSNISVEHLMGGHLAAAYVSARRAIAADDGQSAIWNNMGIIQRRMGNLPLAEASYRQALAINPKDWSALNNLSNIYADRGEREVAARLRASSDLIKLRNPYYRYALAQNAYRRAAYDEALTQLDAALGMRPGEPQFHYLRGLSQWQLGNADSAVRDVKRALETAIEGDSLALYRRQLQQWQDSQR